MLVRAHFGATTSSTLLAFGGALTVLDAGKVTKFTDATFSYTPITVGSSGFVGDTATSDLISWGLWTKATQTTLGTTSSNTPINNLHFVAGQPTAVMPITGSASYYLLGYTLPTLYTGVSGILNSATFSVNFDTSKVNASMVTSFGTVSGSYMSLSGQDFTDGTNSIRGFFSGANAARAGLTYGGYSSANGGMFTGAAVFQK